MEIAKNSIKISETCGKDQDKVRLEVFSTSMLRTAEKDKESSEGNDLKRSTNEINTENMRLCIGCGVVMGNIDIPITKLMEDNTDEISRYLQHEKRSYKCRICNKHIPDRHEMTQHIIDHLKCNEIPCEKCHNKTKRNSKDEQRQLLLDFLNASRSVENKLLSEYRRTCDLRVRPDITFPELVAVDEIEGDTLYPEFMETYACRVCNSDIPTKESTSFHILDHIEANDIFTEEHSRRRKQELIPEPKKPKRKLKKRVTPGTGYVKRLLSVHEAAAAAAVVTKPTAEEEEEKLVSAEEREIEAVSVEGGEEIEKEEEKEIVEKVRIPKIPISMPYGMGYCEQCLKVHKVFDIIFEGTRERDVEKISKVYRSYRSRETIGVEQFTSDQEVIAKKIMEFAAETLAHDENFQSKMKERFKQWERESPLGRPSTWQASDSLANFLGVSGDLNRPSILFSELIAVENLESISSGTSTEYKLICRVCHQEMPSLENISHHILLHLEENELFKSCLNHSRKCIS